MKEELIRKAILEIEKPTFGTTEQYLEVHSVEVENGKHKIERIDFESFEKVNAVYFQINEEPFFLVVYFDKESNVFIDAIYVNSSEVESPIWGAPEFVLAVASIDPNTGLAVEVQSAMQINMCQGSSWFSEFDNKLVLNWEQWHWQERLTFKMVEHDNFTFNGEVTFGAQFLNKNADKTALDISGSANATLTYNGLSEDCGVAYYNYYDPVNQIITFPNFDAQISLRIDDLPNQCEDED